MCVDETLDTLLCLFLVSDGKKNAFAPSKLPFAAETFVVRVLFSPFIFYLGIRVRVIKCRKRFYLNR